MGPGSRHRRATLPAVEGRAQVAGTPFELAAADAALVRSRLGAHDVAVVLGSGWAGAGERLGRVLDEVPMADLAGLPAPTVEGHPGRIASVDVDGVRTLVFLGRVHLYEGHPVAAVVHGVRTAVLAGCGTVVLTNAAGSLRPEVGVGSPVLVSDHLNLTGANPLVGRGPFPAGHPRFVDLTRLYSPRLREAARAADPSLAEGVYAGLLGGSFETPAEIRMLRTLGADLVGMSTVLEAVAAHHLGAEVAGVSLVTNLAAGLADHVDHLEVLAAGDASADRLVDVLGLLVAAA